MVKVSLPAARATDPARREKAGVPQKVGFRTKPQIALRQMSPRASLKKLAPLAKLRWRIERDYEELQTGGRADGCGNGEAFITLPQCASRLMPS